MIKEAIFCDICGAHVYENTSTALHMIMDIAPIIAMRNISKNEKTQKTDVVLCINCEKDIYNILHNNNAKRVK